MFEGGVVPVRWRAIGEVDETLLGRDLQHGGHVPHPDIGVEEEDAIPSLLAQGDGHVHRDGGLADTSLGCEDADHASLAHHLRIAHLARHAGGIPWQGAPTPDEHGLEPIDERLGRAGLHGVLVATRAVVGRLVAKDQDGWDVAAVV